MSCVSTALKRWYKPLYFALYYEPWRFCFILWNLKFPPYHCYSKTNTMHCVTNSRYTHVQKRLYKFTHKPRLDCSLHMMSLHVFVGSIYNKAFQTVLHEIIKFYRSCEGVYLLYVTIADFEFYFLLCVGVLFRVFKGRQRLKYSHLASRNSSSSHTQ